MRVHYGVQVRRDGSIGLTGLRLAGAPDSPVVMLREIQADRVYQLRSADRGTLGMLHGADLLNQGLEIMRAPESAAQVLVLEPIAISDPSRVSSVTRPRSMARRPARRASPAGPRR